MLLYGYLTMFRSTSRACTFCENCIFLAKTLALCSIHSNRGTTYSKRFCVVNIQSLLASFLQIQPSYFQNKLSNLSSVCITIINQCWAWGCWGGWWVQRGRYFGINILSLCVTDLVMHALCWLIGVGVLNGWVDYMGIQMEGRGCKWYIRLGQGGGINEWAGECIHGNTAYSVTWSLIVFIFRTHGQVVI